MKRTACGPSFDERPFLQRPISSRDAHAGLLGYVHFLSVATGSAAEAAYLLDVAARLGILDGALQTPLGSRYSELLRSLQKLTSSFYDQV
jgi:23S rRNA-intervening sequence protein